uniref:Uncharacterized protein n=2 Tax=Picea TaxID=3328 RepID=A0A101M558_PICGL|nr:hypothetical protein ABT39_MTgene1036 [Picea glauca]QHR90039.1 hypothetical protein Q903MT_gene4062 [Picea sitchensis]
MLYFLSWPNFSILLFSLPRSLLQVIMPLSLSLDATMIFLMSIYTLILLILLSGLETAPRQLEYLSLSIAG